MKIFAFTDNHDDLEVTRRVYRRIKKYNPDLILCAGDFSLWGEKIKKILTKFDSFNKKFFIVHGNHEEEHEVERVAKRLKNVEFIHNKVVEFNDVFIVGYGGGGFSYSEHKLETLTKRVRLRLKGKKSIFLTHAPIFNTKIDIIPILGHRGSKSARRYIEIIKPKLVICGHFHETFNQVDKIGKTVILNPGPLGKLITL